MAIPTVAIYANVIVILLLMFFSMNFDRPGISKYDIGQNFANVLIQLIMLTFCWRISRQSTTNLAKEKAKRLAELNAS